MVATLQKLPWVISPKFRLQDRFVTCRIAERISGKKEGEVRTTSARQMFIDADLRAEQIIAATKFAGWNIDAKRVNAWCEQPNSGNDIAITMPELAAVLWAVDRFLTAKSASANFSEKPSLNKRKLTCQDCNSSLVIAEVPTTHTVKDELICQCGTVLLKVESPVLYAAI